MKSILFFLLLLTSSTLAQTPVLDNYFGVQGIAVVPGTTEIYKTIITANGDIISTGYSIPWNNTDTHHLTLTKHYPDGNINEGFGIDGIVEHHIGYSSMPVDLALQSDGKIIVSGYIYLGSTPDVTYETHAFAARFLSNGQLDSSFAINGVFELNTSQSLFVNLFIENDNSILLCGSLISGGVLVKLSADGNMDPGFGINGLKELSAPGFQFSNPTAIRLSDGNILVVGQHINSAFHKPCCQKRNFDGELVTSFGENGRFIYNGTSTTSGVINNAYERQDGKIVLTGYISGKVLLRIDEDGILDTNFGNNGLLSHNFPDRCFLVQEDNKILLGGNINVSSNNSDISITRLDEEGQLDPQFNNTGNYILSVSAGNEDIVNFQFMNETSLLINGATTLTNNNYDFMLAKLDISPTLSAKELISSDFSIYPNPTENILFIEGISPQKIRILNTLGQLIAELPYNKENGVSLENLSSGSYIITFEDEKGITVATPFVKY